MKDHLTTDNSPIVIYSCFLEQFHAPIIESIKKSFKESGHTRELEFRPWDFFNNLPERDGDFYIYDVMALNELVDKGFLRELPDIIDTKDLVEWSIDTTKVKGKSYGVPFLLCCDAIICKKEDVKERYTIDDLRGNTVCPLKSLISYFYWKLCANCPDRTVIEGDPFGIRKVPFAALLGMVDILGGKETLNTLDTAHAPEMYMRFAKGEFKYLFGFGESIGIVSGKDYCVSPFTFSNNKEDTNKLMYVDHASIGANVFGEKLLDCIDLMENFTSTELQYNLCCGMGQSNFISPSNKKVFTMLKENNPEYKYLEDIFLDPENCATRMSDDFYDSQRTLKEHLLKLINES